MEEQRRYMQWLVGERQGEVVIFDHVEEDDGLIFICFRDKSRINESFVAPINQTDATGKLMAEIDHPNNVWKFETKIVGDETGGRVEKDWESQVAYEIPSVTEIASDGQKVPVKRKQITLIPPRRSAPKTSNFGNIVNQPVQQAPLPSTLLSNLDKTDPVYILISKSKKFDSEIEMFLTISLPAQNLYNIAKESFDEGDSKFIDYIVSDINNKDIINALRDAIKNMYESNK